MLKRQIHFLLLFILLGVSAYSTEDVSSSNKAPLFLILAQKVSVTNQLLEKHLKPSVKTEVFYLNSDLKINETAKTISYRNKKFSFDEIDLVYMRTMGNERKKKIRS